jgi:hypothetical protein
MVDPDHRMADLAALVSRLPVAAWASYLETWHVMKPSPISLQLQCPKKFPGVTV